MKTREITGFFCWFFFFLFFFFSRPAAEGGKKRSDYLFVDACRSNLCIHSPTLWSIGINVHTHTHRAVHTVDTCTNADSLHKSQEGFVPDDATPRLGRLVWGMFSTAERWIKEEGRSFWKNNTGNMEPLAVSADGPPRQVKCIFSRCLMVPPFFCPNTSAVKLTFQT